MHGGGGWAARSLTIEEAGSQRELIALGHFLEPQALEGCLTGRKMLAASASVNQHSRERDSPS
jgi:hypothetical protein